MTERKDYMVKVKLNASNKPTVSIHCALCSKEYKLNEKVTSEPTDKPTFMLSNCMEIKNRKIVRQQTLSQFLPPPSNNTTQGARMCVKQPAHDKGTQGETLSKSTTFEHAATEKSLEQSIPLVLGPEKPCCNNSSTGSSGSSSSVTEPEEARETKECANTIVDSYLKLDSHLLLVKSNVESSLPCNTISSARGFSDKLSCVGESGEFVTFSPNHKAPLDWSYKSRKTKKF